MTKSNMHAPAPSKILSKLDCTLVNTLVDKDVFNKKIVVGVCMHNSVDTIRQCLMSITEQDIFSSDVAIVLLDDASTDNWMESIQDFLILTNLVVISANAGTPSRARNTILDFANINFPNLQWVARLDSDDYFSSSQSLSTMCQMGEKSNAKYVLGGNNLIQNGKKLGKINYASRKLNDANEILKILEQMVDGTAYNEIPSCNLLLAAKSRWRYPDLDSAEDHWLVCDLLINYADEGAILENFLYCNYTLNGKNTQHNTKNGTHFETRKKLYNASKMWIYINKLDKYILGYGMEGIVIKEKSSVQKFFYSNAISDEKVQWMEKTFSKENSFIPAAKWSKVENYWVCEYDFFFSREANNISKAQAKKFLLFCLQKGIVCTNIKRSNFRIKDPKELVYIDIGNSIIPMDISYFLDSAARLYGISELGYNDYELLRRDNKKLQKQEVLFESLDGFFDFYKDLLSEYAQAQWKKYKFFKEDYMLPPSSECSLMIKACSMDHKYIMTQVKHIVQNLQSPRNFYQKILLIDPYEGPFLRQYEKPNIKSLLHQAEKLLEERIIDKILIASLDTNEILAVNKRWFNLVCTETHSVKNIPIAPHVWGFDQVETRYVLQCDLDVLIGRHHHYHDYLTEMIDAAKEENITGIAFNIPHENKSKFKKYDSPLGGYVPEVRCGLLDLHRIKSYLPLPNSIENGFLELSWFRSLEKYQQQNGKRTLRGGDPSTFYIHPKNEWKKYPEKLADIRDLVSQGRIPSFQFEKWDLFGKYNQWEYEKRNEDIVFLLRGRNTPIVKLERCFASLKMQDNQNFGMIVIDDASTDGSNIWFPSLLNGLWGKTTLICNEKRIGWIPNINLAVKKICTQKNTLIVILDLDDALLDNKIVSKLKTKLKEGNDVIHGGMFRPNKPLKIYKAEYVNCREKRGGNVWMHLRAFKKSLYEKIPESELKINDQWIKDCTDFATMIPLVEKSSKPIFIPEYWYLHENSIERSLELNGSRKNIIDQIVNKSYLT